MLIIARRLGTTRSLGDQPENYAKRPQTFGSTNGLSSKPDTEEDLTSKRAALQVGLKEVSGLLLACMLQAAPARV